MPPSLLDVGWTTCARDDCPGAAHPPYGRCLAHLDPGELESALRALSPGQGVDLRGTAVSAELLDLVLDATCRRLGRARFDLARFTGPARFAGVEFLCDATFDRARFDGLASFFGARFTGNASFGEAVFARELTMHGSRVHGHASFDRSSVGSDALFGDACLSSASFDRAEFRGFTSFDGTGFHGEARFRGARFRRAVSLSRAWFDGAAVFEGTRFAAGAFLSPRSVAGRLALAGARADGKLEIDASGCLVDLSNARTEGRLALRLADAEVDLRGLVSRGQASLVRRSGRVRVLSLERLDVDRLSLSGADLSGCHLAGVPDPGRLQLSGCVFATTPRGVQLRLSWPPVRWWSKRQVLADEHAWRFGPARPAVDPGRLKHLYAGLRVDDDRTATDFAFGAMEMRRMSAAGPAARAVLGVYWLLCGYGLRTGRALAWLVLVAAVAAGSLLWSSSAPQHVARRPPWTGSGVPAQAPPPGARAVVPRPRTGAPAARGAVSGTHAATRSGVTERADLTARVAPRPGESGDLPRSRH
ncbi:pentapeptide repeat-containing protein [Microtetraspora malaysiensis]|uniref:pentapeptide repeat-containing protein n=1 Tax=Microtetraspora malaysiensis TaxID=161358 RepID=UPI003D927AE2